MKRSRQLISVLALTAVFAAIVPTLALAKPPTVASEIPYLSHGVLSPTGQSGIYVDDRAVSRSTQKQVEIPYLSHGVLSPTAEPNGIYVDDRVLPRSTPEPTPIVVRTDSGTSIDFGNPAVYGLALMLGLLAGGTVAAIWSNRRTKLSPA
jgi:hypothetical protein